MSPSTSIVRLRRLRPVAKLRRAGPSSGPSRAAAAQPFRRGWRMLLFSAASLSWLRRVVSMPAERIGQRKGTPVVVAVDGDDRAAPYRVLGVGISSESRPTPGIERAIVVHREGQELARPVAAVELRLVHARSRPRSSLIHRGRRGRPGPGRISLNALVSCSPRRQRIGHEEVVVRVCRRRPASHSARCRAGRWRCRLSLKPPHLAAYHSGSFSSVARRRAAGREVRVVRSSGSSRPSVAGSCAGGGL